MLSSFMTLNLLSLLAYTLLAGTVLADSQRILSDVKITFRDYDDSDLDDVTTVLIDAFAPGDSFRYAHPNYEQYKDYYWHCYREMLKKQIADGSPVPDFFKVLAISGRDPSTSLVREERVVSISYWQLGEKTAKHSTGRYGRLIQNFHLSAAAKDQAIQAGDGPPYDCSLHLATNVTRSAQVVQYLEQAQTGIIDVQFPNRFQLQGLATHPAWDGHNFAAMHLQWGFDEAKSRELPITLIGTSVGYPLYRRMGFRNLQNITIPELDDETRGFWFEVMVKDS